MKKLIQLIALQALIFTIFISQVKAQKLFEGYWEQNTITKGEALMEKSQKSDKERIYYKKGKMKIVDLNRNETTIIRVDKDLVWSIDNNRKEYTEMKLSDVQEGVKKAKKIMEKMKQQMENLPPQQREMMEKMMGKSMGEMMGDESGFKISFKKTNETKKINGYKCYKVIYYTNKKPILELWLTDKYRLGSELLEMYKKMGILKGSVTEEAKNLNGFAIQTVTKTNVGFGKMETVSTVTKIVPRSISDKEFELPRGLKKTALPAFPEDLE